MEVKEHAERKVAQLHSRIQRLESHNNRLAEENAALQAAAAQAAPAVSRVGARGEMAGAGESEERHAGLVRGAFGCVHEPMLCVAAHAAVRYVMLACGTKPEPT